MGHFVTHSNKKMKRGMSHFGGYPKYSPKFVNVWLVGRRAWQFDFVSGPVWVDVIPLLGQESVGLHRSVHVTGAHHSQLQHRNVVIRTTHLDFLGAHFFCTVIEFAKWLTNKFIDFNFCDSYLLFSLCLWLKELGIYSCKILMFCIALLNCWKVIDGLSVESQRLCLTD